MKLPTMRVVSALSLVLAGAVLSGCLGPTYGTGKSAGAQLFEDIDGMLALGPKDRERIDYSPRAELVRPKDTSILPPPQNAPSTAANWPESPEQRSARIRAAADARNTDGVIQTEDALAAKEGVGADEIARNTNGRDSNRVAGILSPDELRSGREAFKKRLAESQQGSPTQRKYLSEPPVAYRQPAASAPVNDPGEDESVKEARLNKKDGSWGDKLKALLPF